jgi:serine/threonine protein kinase
MSIALSCTACGELLLPADRFCIQCGAPTTGGTPAAVRPSHSRNELLHRLEQVTRGVYDVAGELGRGGMAVVYLAHDIEADRKVAIKVLSPVLEHDPEAVKRFRQDAQTAARLEHPHIIPIYRVESRGTPVFFVMKYVDGGALDVILQKGGPFAVSVTRTVIGQVGRALDYAHRKGVVHRDVKPGNVLLDREGWVVVSDFGIAKLVQQRGLTVTGSLVGTPTYMSPEQCRANQDLTGASDQYGLGVVAYELLTGRPPFVADSHMDVVLAHLQETARPITDARPDCPADLADAIMRMLAKKPEERWPSMRDAVTAIGGNSREPLGGDPESARILHLAQDTGSRNAQAQVATPTSPIPIGTLPRGVGTLRLEPDVVTLRVGETLRLRVQSADQAGRSIAPPELFWASSDTGVARVSMDGVVTARAPGSAVIHAAGDGLVATATLTVTGR